MSFDLNDLSPEEIIELASNIFEESMEKEASEDLPYGFDLNDLDLEDFLEFADDLAGEMEKEAKVKSPSWAKIKMGPHSEPTSPGILKRIKKHYAGRETSRKSRIAKSYVARGKKGKFGKSRFTEAKGTAREYAPEAAAGTAAVGTAAYARSRRKKNRGY